MTNGDRDFPRQRDWTTPVSQSRDFPSDKDIILPIITNGDLTYDMLVVFQAQMLDAIDVLTTKGIPAVIVGTTSETKQGLLGPTKTDSIILRVTEAHRLLLWEAGIALKYAPRDTLVVKKDDN